MKSRAVSRSTTILDRITSAAVPYVRYDVVLIQYIYNQEMLPVCNLVAVCAGDDDALSSTITVIVEI